MKIVQIESHNIVCLHLSELLHVARHGQPITFLDLTQGVISSMLKYRGAVVLESKRRCRHTVLVEVQCFASAFRRGVFENPAAL